MKRLALIVVLVLGGVVAVVIRGSGAVPDQPVPIAWDRELCGHCHMHVGDPRHAAQLVTDDGDVVSFDDVGCAFQYLDAHHPAVHRLWFHGAGARWIPSERAMFLTGGDSPMGSGLLAFDVQELLP